MSRAKTLFVALALVTALALPVLSFDFGVTEDEQLHNNHGHSILDYFLGRSSAAARNPIADSGKLEFEYDREANDLSGALNIYGGFFDLLCATTYRYLSPFGEFENRHFINSLFGVLLIVATGLTARHVAGWRAGILALLLMTCSPRIIGHSMNNPVDLPFAALYMLSIFLIMLFVDELPRPKAQTWVPLLIAIPLAAEIRIAGLVLIFYLGLFGAVWTWLRVPLSDRKNLVRSLGITALLCIGAYLLISVFWPFAHRNPFTTPLLALEHLSKLETFNARDLFGGRWIDRPDLPWHFPLTWLVIGTPLFVPLGMALSPLVFARRKTPEAGEQQIDLGKVGLIVFTSVFPVLFIILRGSYIYNDARHVLFAYPPLIVLCALAFESGLRLCPRFVKIAVAVLLAGTLLQPMLFMVRNHPNENVYFSPLIGGIRGAWQRYETDFWGNSIRQAVEWIQANTDPAKDGTVRIRLWYGDQTKSAYYVAKKPGYEHVVVDVTSEDWDFHIKPTVATKYTPEQLAVWPIPGTVYEIKADGIPLTAVIVNFRGREHEEVLRHMREWAEEDGTHATWLTLAESYLHYGMEDEFVDAFREAARLEPEPLSRTHDNYIETGLALHRGGHPTESLEAYRLALRQDPESSVAYNNFCSTHNLLGQWAEAKTACEKALALDPDFAMAADNLQVAIRGLSGE